MKTIQDMVIKIMDDHNKYKARMAKKVEEWETQITLDQSQLQKAKTDQLLLEVSNIEQKQLSYHAFVNARNSEAPVHLNVGGENVAVARGTLTAVKGSLLAAQFSGNAAIKDNVVKQGDQ